MTRCLLAAEADKIQDLIFRSAHLREVVGGSQLLSRFCQDAPAELLQALDIRDAKVLINDGGSFRLLFADEPPACNFGRALAQLYREVTGGTLTVADPQSCPDDAAFPQANEAAQQALMIAKAQGRPISATAQAPYVAFCASCGVGLAKDHWTADPKNERPNYICPSCRAKTEARQDEAHLDFVWDFVRAVKGDAARQYDWPRKAEDLTGEWEPRNYVAYLAADGNGLGRLFGQCTDPEQLKRLSQALPQVLRESLAEPTKLLMAHAPQSEKDRRRVPVLPLILGGDDVFALLPAVYALDFAQRFCSAYEQRMTIKLQEIGIQAEKHPTMSAAVVICKSKYPHTLVHRRAEELLGEVKRFVKAEAQAGYHGSAVHWEVIVGNQLASHTPNNQSMDFQAGMRPYWANVAGGPGGAGLALQRILCQRYALRNLPTGRLAQLEALFEPDALPKDKTDAELGRWKHRMEGLSARVARSKSQTEALQQALGTLGGTQYDYWYYLNRQANPKLSPYAHALPDLLQAWDFSLSLDHDRKDYEQQEG